jgi:DNA-binding beta-propeller fold protein YncE
MAYRRWLACVSVLVGLLFFACSIPAYADGGAPNLAYVAGTPSGVSVIDVRQRKVTATLKVPGDPHTTVLSQDGSILYVTEPQQGRVVALLAQTGQTVCTAPVMGHPTLMAFDLNTNLLYIAANDAALVTALDPATCQVKIVIHTNGNVFGLATVILSSGVPGSAGDQLWIAAKTLTGYDDLNGQQIARVSIPGPQYVTIPPGETIYVTTARGSVDAVDISSHRVETLLSGGNYGPMDYDATTEEVYVPDRTHQQIVVLNPAIVGSPLPHEPGRIIHLAAAPQSIAITSDGQLGFVALSNESVVMLDLPGHTIVATIPVGGIPHFIITGLYPPTTTASSQQTSTVGTVSTTRVIGLISIIVFIVSAILLLLLLSVFIIRRMKDRQNNG